jgi:serine/threonine-protein kinase
MSIDRIETLLAILQRTQVLTPQEVEEVGRELGPHFPTPDDLARYLTDIDWLTPYQVRLLFSDRWHELRIGHYLVLDRLGEGGVGEVFKAWDTVKGRTVALKVLHQHLADHSAAVRELQRELQAVMHLSHPNIIRTFEANQVGTTHYFAMEYVEGLDLDRYVGRCGPLPIEAACEQVRQAALGLQHAHHMGLVHRDIKPADLFLVNPPPSAASTSTHRVSDSVIKILDWGLARMRPDARGAANPPGVDLSAEKGALIGTADYIAPEQARNPCLVDMRGDIYSLGCTLYFLLTGRPPFGGSSLMQKLLQHQEAERPEVREARPEVPKELAGIVRRMMAREPEERYAIPLLAAGALRHFIAAAAASRADSLTTLVKRKPSTAIIDMSALRRRSQDY